MPDKGLKALIWLYVVLLIFEGALRKWVFPDFADWLLIIRDPVVLVIYVLAAVRGKFPANLFILAVAVLAAASVLASLAAGQHNLVVTLYGLRINYLHLPLIWVMATVLDRHDVQRLGSFLLLVAIPMALLMVEQFRSPMTAPVNRGVGGSEVGQIFGAAGRIRPPGFFAFITGPQVFLPLAAAFFFHQAAVRRRLPWALLLAAGAALAVSLPVSISRTAMLATALVAVTFAVCLPFVSQRGGSLLRTAAVGGVLLAALSFLPVFREGRDVFLERWTTAAAATDGDAWQGVSNRLFGGFFQPFRTMLHARPFGAGIGVGSNVGARLLSGRVGFLLAEDEWTKVILELGPFLGGAFLLFRVVLTCYLGLLALRALLQDHEALPLLLFAASGVAVFQYQWGPPTLLGFAVVGAGLVLAALKPAPEEAAAPLAEAARPTPPSPTPARPADRRPPAAPRVPVI